jgi:hypothetical protein
VARRAFLAYQVAALSDAVALGSGADLVKVEDGPSSVRYST